jgi:glucokinase
MWNLLADVGGTHMRIAAASETGTILDQKTYPSNDGVGCLRACEAVIAERESTPATVVVAAAGVVTDGAVVLTNSDQSFSEADLVRVCATPDVRILNDFEAAAWSLATVTGAETTCLQGPTDIPEGPRVIIGPGTGLGVGALIRVQGRPHVIPGEGGHISLSPRSADDLCYFEHLVRLWPQVRMGQGVAVEAEAVLSGTGLPVMYRAIAAARKASGDARHAKQIFDAARAGTDENAQIAVDLFRRYLGAVAGDLGLVYGASGGVFVTGGLAISNPWVFDQAFVDAFNAGGRHSHWRKKLPLYLYRNTDFGLLGARNYLASH